MTKELADAIRHIKTRADGWAVREIENALSQEPRTTTNNNEPMTMVYPTIVCNDAISREDALMCLTGMFKLNKNYNPEELIALFSKRIKALPPVTHKSGKWDRLYSWLNDMRLGIAPDETVTDIDERHCRESQTDILDEIMEWMVRAESKGQTE